MSVAWQSLLLVVKVQSYFTVSLELFLLLCRNQQKNLSVLILNTPSAREKERERGSQFRSRDTKVGWELGSWEKLKSPRQQGVNWWRTTLITETTNSGLKRHFVLNDWNHFNRDFQWCKLNLFLYMIKGCIRLQIKSKLKSEPFFILYQFFHFFYNLISFSTNIMSKKENLYGLFHLMYYFLIDWN